LGNPNPDKPEKWPLRRKDTKQNYLTTVQGSEVLGSKVTPVGCFSTRNVEPLNLGLCFGALVAKMFCHKMHKNNYLGAKQ